MRLWWNGIHNRLKICRRKLAGSNPANRTNHISRKSLLAKALSLFNIYCILFPCIIFLMRRHFNEYIQIIIAFTFIEHEDIHFQLRVLILCRLSGQSLHGGLSRILFSPGSVLQQDGLHNTALEALAFRSFPLDYAGPKQR